MNKKLLSLYSLKFNPFSPEVPTSALWSPPSIENFCWRIEQQIGEGGFALAIGDPGTGKSAALRILAEHLGNLRDVVVGVLSRPQASLADFYRELGHLFSVPLAPHNRWASAKALREKWLHHIENSLYRPVLLIDEAQEMSSAGFALHPHYRLGRRSSPGWPFGTGRPLTHCQPDPGTLAHRSPGPVRTTPLSQPPAQNGR
jgi:general secretion pathway protein A